MKEITITKKYIIKPLSAQNYVLLEDRGETEETIPINELDKDILLALIEDYKNTMLEKWANKSNP